MDGASDHLGEVAYLTFVLVAIGLHAAFDEHQAALAKILMAGLRQASPGLDIDPLGILPSFTGIIRPAMSDGNREVGHPLACLRIFAFRVTAQIADELNAVQGWHVSLLRF